MRQLLTSVIALVTISCAQAPPASSYLFVWAGDKDKTASDFLGVIDANPASPRYGAIVASIPVGENGTYPHHTENEMSASGHLLANGFGAGKTWLFDLTEPDRPKILTSFGDKAGLSHPHSYVRLPNGEVLATFQYAEGAQVPDGHAHGGSAAAATPPAKTGTAPQRIAQTTGGLVLMTERGDVIRSASARDPNSSYSSIYPYYALPIPAIDRVLSSTTDMDDKNTSATSEWLQLWRLSDLKLLKTFALPPGPRGDEHKFTGEVRLLADGKSAYVHTFNCGLYLVRNLDTPEPHAMFVKSFTKTDCGVPAISGHFWLQPVPYDHALISLDISDPEHPREVSRVTFGEEEGLHWLALDPTGRRAVLGSAGPKPNRIFIINVDATTGALAIDDRFRDPGAPTPGVSLAGQRWPHGFNGEARPHGTVFSRR